MLSIDNAKKEIHMEKKHVQRIATICIKMSNGSNEIQTFMTWEDSKDETA